MNPENVFVSCPVCQANMTLAQLNGHQTHHTALKTLKFKQEGPGSSEVLLKRRRLMVKRIVSKYKEQPGKEGLLERIDKLDTSFDVVQANLHRGMSLLRTLEPHIERPSLKEGSLRHEPEDLNNDIQSNGVWEGLPNCIAAIGTCEAMNIEHRDTMEDRTLIKPEFLSHATPKEKSHSCCYIGLYDGHHGQAAVTHTKQLLHSYIEQEIDRISESSHNDEENLDPDEILNKLNNVKISTLTGDTCHMPQSSNILSTQTILQCMANSYTKLDRYLQHGIGEKSRIRWSGCSATSLIITDEVKPTKTTSVDGSGDHVVDSKHTNHGKIFVANSGNIEAYMFHKNQAYPLTTLHTPHHDMELKRVTSAGGKIVQNNRYPCVNGVSQTTRGLGNHGDPKLKSCVIPTPSTTSSFITDDTQFIVMATTSLWNLLDIGNVTRIIQSTSKLLSEKTDITRMYHEPLEHHSPVEGSEAEEVSDDLERKLTSIVETDEENCDGIEEVIIIQGTDDFDDDSTQLSVDHDDHATMGTTENVQSDPISHQQHENKQMAGLAKVMCERLVQAALSAGAIENISVAIVLLKK